MAEIVREYTVVLSPEEEGGFSVTVPVLPEIATQGEDIEEALAIARDAIELSLAYRRDEGLPIPEDAAQVQRVNVSITRSGPCPKKLSRVKPRDMVRAFERAGLRFADRPVRMRFTRTPTAGSSMCRCTPALASNSPNAIFRQAQDNNVFI